MLSSNHMFRARLTLLTAAVVFASYSQTPSQQIAVVTGLQGAATVTAAQGAQHSIHLLEWLEVSSTVTTAKDAHIVLVFADGQRCEIAPSSKVSVTPQGPRRISGDIHTLPPLPPMPPLPAIASGQVDSDRVGALRLRSHAVEDLYPADPNTVLPDHAVLRFRPVAAGATYVVDLRDAANKQVFHAKSTANEINVPAGSLKAGQHYHWSVSALVSFHYGQAEFDTLSESTLANRATYRSAHQNAMSGAERDSILARLAVDRSLGLLIEVRDQLRTIVEQSPGDQPFQDLLKEIERTLQPDPPSQQ
jgi:hypothetical protein